MRNRIDSFASLRGYACVMIILAQRTLNWELPILDLLINGEIQVVDFLFVISAYLLSRNHTFKVLPDPTKPPKRILNNTLVKYAIRRFLRTYPAYVGAIVFNFCSVDY